ncbi:hypothetical protein SEA_ECLIPTUS_59 [Gordonia phage Ecliptus]|nr:hypothetical protein SEA_ECLIPTUS_59 [Gordonia phage Ecliptus]
MQTDLLSAEDLELLTDKITHAVVMVSAETATRWLKLNKRNRNLSRTDVQRYRLDMEAGLWRFAADPLRFDVNGNLIDGQHRLTALSELPGVCLPMLVVRGLPAETQKVMDQGRKRTPGQQLYLSGVKDANLMAAVFKVLLVWETGLMFRDNSLQRQITSAAIEEYIFDRPDDLEFAQQHANIIRAIDAPPSVVGAFAVIASRADRESAHDFMVQLHSMVGMSLGHPVHTLDKRLRSIRKQSLRISQRDYLALFIQAFVAYQKGRKISQFLRPPGGTWTPENFPKVVA